MGSTLMAVDENRVFMALGAIQAEIKTLREDFRDLEENTTTEHRKVHDIVVATSEAVRNLVRVVDEMKPLTDDYREKRAEARGAARLAGWLYTAAGVIGGGVAYIAGKVIEWVAARPHVPVIAVIILLLALAGSAMAHDGYHSWFNRDDVNCCNNQDCGHLADTDERTDGGILAVRIEGQWCPVLPHHYLKRGNVPDASTSHVCVQKSYKPGVSACERLLCYQPRPGS